MKKLSLCLWTLFWTSPFIASGAVNSFFYCTETGTNIRLRQETQRQELIEEVKSFAVHDPRWGDGIEPLTDQEWAACKSYIGHKYWYGGGLHSYCQERMNTDNQ